MRLLLALTVLWLLFAAAPASAMPGAEGAGPEEDRADGGLTRRLTEEQLEAIDTGAIEAYWNRLMREYGGFFPDRKPPGFADLLRPDGETLDIGAALTGIVRYLLYEVIQSGRLIGTIVLLTVFCMILETVQSAFEQGAVSRAAYAVAFMVLLVIAANSFNEAFGYAREAIGGMIEFMIAMVPLLLTLLASTGSVVTVTVMHPLIVFTIYAVGTLIQAIVFPLLFFSAVLHIASSLSERFKATQLADLMRAVGAGTLGVLLTVFLGVIAVQGAVGSVTDGVALRTAKFVTGNFVPVVGRMFSDAADAVLSASVIVKNAVGIAGVVILLFLCLFPAVKIVALAVIYRLSAAVLQPLGPSPIASCLEAIGKTMVHVFAAVAAVGMMFFLAVAVILAAGNAALMIR
ncbi:MAG: stage III sporulation protein AE [Thermobacillus sp. ZCTH02-B1]|uniref:stage III sporulation protein AE n=1 Tax=Thermobacillus sp. ZCTH02-B1 TaxID=1858795 RepID=UPI000B569E91|nr:stage III sporulation protein AE [Thermobacillus sp. ZCTH02-B1]OUM96873.1 MAG: stage III sporulation protein AE [Thermobacillus sp. ZCTH02-B1]